MQVTFLWFLGLNDFNDLRAEDIQEREDADGDSTGDPYCQEEGDNDPHFEEEIADINKGIQELEEKIRQMNDQCGIHCSKTTRLPCVAHKASKIVI